MSDPALDTVQLIRDARRGSSAAKEELIRSVQTYLLLIANQEIEPQLRQKIAASDLVQETCLVAADQFSRFRGTTVNELRAWLRRILLNSMGQNRRKYILSQKRAAALEVDLEGGLNVPDRDASPRASIIAREESLRLNAALERLSEEHQRVLRLRNWELLPFAEIGKQMDRSREAAQKLWSRAVKRLEQELGRE